MKVITQLVKHFWQRGALAAAEVEYLIRHGFVRLRDLPGYTPPPEDESPGAGDTWIEKEIELPGELEHVEESLVRRRGKRGTGQAKGQTIDVKEICRRASKELARRETALTRLVRVVAGRSAADWRGAAQALRQSPAKTHEALAKALREGKLTLADAWLALDMEPFHRLLADNELRGRAANAYSALLVADQVSTLGKYSWILQHDELQALNNLRIAHAAFLAGMGRLYCHSVRVLTKSLARGCDPVVVWGLVLLHNAHRSQLNPKDSRVVPDYGPIELPPNELWQQAWTAALGMDRRRITEFLVLCYQHSAGRASRSLQVLSREFYCPNGWHLPA
jgi:hypothetical protein